MTDEVIKQAAEAIADNTSMDNPVMNAEESTKAAKAAYEIFRADFVRQLESEIDAAMDAFWEEENRMYILNKDRCTRSQVQAALKAVAERIK